MRNLFYAVFVLLAVAGLSISCADETIGSSLNDTSATIIEDSTFTITGVTVRSTHLRSRSSYQLIGKINSPGYGTLTSDAVMQFMPASSIVTEGVTADKIDSCRLLMAIDAGDFTGDSLATMRMSVYRLNKQLPNPIYSDFNPSGYYSAGDFLGSTAYSATAIQQGTSSAAYRTVSVPMPVELGRELFNKYKSSPETFATPSGFAEFFPGIYITNTYGEGLMMNFHNTELRVYFRKQLDSGKDTTSYQSYMAVTPEVLYNNNISLSIDQSIQDLIDAGEAIVMSPAGLEVKLNFPIQEIINSYKAKTADGIAIINSLELELPVSPIYNDWGIEPPQYLLMVKDGMRDQFFDNDTLTNNKDSFYAKYNPLTHKYVFTGMRDYILNIINKQNGVATSADINLTILPIDVSLYTQQASYYTAATTVVTKIGPAVSRPGLALLLLNQAKARITYSKHSMN